MALINMPAAPAFLAAGSGLALVAAGAVAGVNPELEVVARLFDDDDGESGVASCSSICLRNCDQSVAE